MSSDRIPGRLDLDRIRANLVDLPALSAALGPDLLHGQRFAGRNVQACPIVLVWLHRWTDESRAKTRLIESQLNQVKAGIPDGYEKLALRIVRAHRNDHFGVLAELYVAAWYLRSGKEPKAVLKENAGGGKAEADLVIADGTREAFVESYETVGNREITEWESSWAELGESLGDLALPFTIDVSGAAMFTMSYRLGETRDHRREMIRALDHHEIEAIARAVLSARDKRRPLILGSPIKRYSDLKIELRDGPSVVFTSTNPSGRHFGAPQLAAKLLEKSNGLADYGRTVLVVELSRFALDVLSFHRGELQLITEALSKSNMRWDAVIAFIRDWKTERPYWTALLYSKQDAEPLLPQL